MVPSSDTNIFHWPAETAEARNHSEHEPSSSLPNRATLHPYALLPALPYPIQDKMEYYHSNKAVTDKIGIRRTFVNQPIPPRKTNAMKSKLLPAHIKHETSHLPHLHELQHPVR
ncbi:hypothetical protein Dimus_022421 [Dionaea muscipula]